MNFIDFQRLLQHTDFRIKHRMHAVNKGSTTRGSAYIGFEGFVILTVELNHLNVSVPVNC